MENLPPPERPLRWGEIIQSIVAGLLIVALITAALFAYRRGVSAAAAPDVIIIVVADALRADRLSCYAAYQADGQPAVPTPHIDSLAQDGVLYRYMNTQSAWTKPSVATLLSSLYPSTHRALTEEDILPDAVLTLPEILATHGYHTVGFVANTNLFHELNFQQGYQEYYDLDPAESTFIRHGDRFYQEAERVNWRVLPWVEAHHDQRFFMYIHYMDPHDPYFIHPYDGRSFHSEDKVPAWLLRDIYDGEIAYFDQHFGNLLATLKRLGLYDQALIIFTADHGEEFYEHQGWAHGKTLYQEIMNVPLIIKYPGNARAGTVDEGLARMLDVAPTVLDVAGIAPPATMQGVSLRLPPTSPARTRPVFAEDPIWAGVMAIRTTRYKLIQVTTGDPRGRGQTQLYDLEVDPGETINLAPRRPDLVAQLDTDLRRILAQAEETAITGQGAELSPEFRERLRRLGY